MVCLGETGAVRIQLSSTGYDSGRAVPCAESPKAVSLTVGLADLFSMRVNAETGGSEAVFRWRLDHAPGL